MEQTINSESRLGKRLAKILKSEAMYIKFEGKDIPLTSIISIGRARDNRICIADDNLISRRHAVLQKIHRASFIKDLGSCNGTWVNEQRVPPFKYMRVQSGDVIRIGRTKLSIKSFLI